MVLVDSSFESLSVWKRGFQILVAKIALAGCRFQNPKSLAVPLLSPVSAHLMLDPQLVGNHRDELRVRWFGFRDINRITKQMADAVDVATSPSDFDRMTDGAFDAGRRRFEFLGDGWVQRFRNRAKNFNVVVHHRDRFAQILIAFNMRGNADFMNDTRNVGIKVLRLAHLYHIGARHDAALQRRGRH